MGPIAFAARNEHDDPAHQCNYADDRRERNRVMFLSRSVDRANVQNFFLPWYV